MWANISCVASVGESRTTFMRLLHDRAEIAAGAGGAADNNFAAHSQIAQQPLARVVERHERRLEQNRVGESVEVPRRRGAEILPLERKW